MGGGAYFSTTPFSVKKYAKMKPRRLISGFLTVNVVHHSDNEASTYSSATATPGLPTNGNDDAMQEIRDHWDGSASGEREAFQEANPMSDVQPNDPTRSTWRHSFADYDCLLFWVTGGMTLHKPSFSGVLNQSDLHGHGFLTASSGSANWNDDVTGSYDGNSFDSSEKWYSTIIHPCQHFFKVHLVGRMNNAYGNITDGHYQPFGIQTNTFELNDNSHTHRAISSSSGGVEDHISAPGDASDLASVLAGYSSGREGQWQRYILSNGVYSPSTNTSSVTVNGSGDIAYKKAIGSATITNDLGTDRKNSYFSPLESVEVFGSHQYNIPERNEGGKTIFSATDTNAGGGNNYSHTEDYFDMVIKINYASYDSDSTGTSMTSTADKQFFKTRTNVFFQPFGETASISFSDTPHTS